MKTSILALFALTGAALAAPSDPAYQALEEERLDQSGTVITIVFDDSGSMAGERMEQAKAAFRDWLDTVPAEHRLGLVTLNAGLLVKWNRGNKDEVSRAVAAMRPGGGTPLADTIDVVRKGIATRQKEKPFERHVLVVFTDGEDTTPRGIVGVQESLGSAARDSVETVGIGFHGAGDYMRGTSTRYFDAQNTEELRQGLQKVDAEIGDTTDLVISPEVAEAMKTVTVADMIPRKPEPASSDSSESVSSPLQISPTFIFVVIVIVVIVSKLAGKVLRGR